MTEFNARKLVDKFLPSILNTPISKDSEIKIKEAELWEVEQNCFQVFILGRLPKDNTIIKRFLLNYIEEFNLLLDRKEFDLPEKDV